MPPFVALVYCICNTAAGSSRVAYNSVADLEGDPGVQRNPLLLVLCRILGSFITRKRRDGLYQGHCVCT